VPLIDGGTQRLPHVVGLGRTLEITRTGRTGGDEEVLAIGLVTELVEPGRPFERAQELAEALAAFPSRPCSPVARPCSPVARPCSMASAARWPRALRRGAQRPATVEVV
jgi:enoyl-CoA hydratase/carnithine racemase